MEFSDIKIIFQCLFGKRAQLLDFQFAHLVGQRLTWPHDVPVDFHDDVVLGFSSVGLEVVDRSLPAPAKVVQASVHHQPDGPPHLVGQLTKFRVWIRVKTHLFAKAFCVQRPALDVHCVAPVLAKFRQTGQLVRDSQLQMMARHRLVQRQSLHLPLGPHG